MPSSHYNYNVFINCPFDKDYVDLFHSIVFAVQDCGFVARCALERGDSGETRIEKILRIISECKYGIHDISRTELDRKSKLPRFNMPLELGIFLGAKQFGFRNQKQKQCLILDRQRYRFQKFCSDIAGQDIEEHKNSPRKAIHVVRNWFGTLTAGNTVLPGGTMIYKRYKAFQKELPVYCEPLLLKPEELIFNDYTVFIEEWLRANEQ
ncbi:MAG: hypothetical protein ACI8V2_001001 [Candidatus Latescibacterota bacterium]|jgi:hypothetical protein